MAEESSGGMDAFWIILIVLTLFALWVQGGGPARSQNSSIFKVTTPSGFYTPSSGGSNSSDQSNTNNKTTANESNYKGQVYVQAGTASSADSPNFEYVILSASSNNYGPVKIGGWSLRNGRDERTFETSAGNQVRGQSVTAKIPSTGIEAYNPLQPSLNKAVPLALKPGEQAIIITGQFPNINSASFRANFKINRCLGYFQDEASYYGYYLPYNLNYNCHDNSDIPNFKQLDEVCYNFVRSMGNCHAPKDIYDDNNQTYCPDGNCQITTNCQNFIKANYSFQACYNRYSKEKDFTGGDWIISLGRTWELWDNDRDSISLYDAAGKLVDKTSYGY